MENRKKGVVVLSGSLARDTTPVAKWMATWRGYVAWPLGSHSQVATGLDNTCQHLLTNNPWRRRAMTPRHDATSWRHVMTPSLDVVLYNYFMTSHYFSILNRCTIALGPDSVLQGFAPP